MINFVRIIPQDDIEKKAMYMKSTKSELADMLIQANKHIDDLIGDHNESLGGQAACNHTFIVTDQYWQKCHLCGLIKPTQGQ